MVQSSLTRAHGKARKHYQLLMSLWANRWTGLNARFWVIDELSWSTYSRICSWNGQGLNWAAFLLTMRMSLSLKRRPLRAHAGHHSCGQLGPNQLVGKDGESSQCLLSAQGVVHIIPCNHQKGPAKQLLFVGPFHRQEEQGLVREMA